jgi:hypothetical protein
MRVGRYTHDACWTGLSREVLGFKTTRKNGLQASVCQAFSATVECRVGRTADGHAKALIRVTYDSRRAD